MLQKIISGLINTMDFQDSPPPPQPATEATEGDTETPGKNSDKI